MPRGKVESRPFLIDWDRDGDDDFVFFEAREEMGPNGNPRRRYQIFVETKRDLSSQAGSRNVSAGTLELTSFSLGPESPFENGSEFIPGDLQPQFILTFGDINNDGAFDIVFTPRARAGLELPRGIFAMLNAAGEGIPQFAAPVKIASLEPDSIAVADVDQDGYPEIAVNEGGQIKLLFLGCE